MEKCDYCDKEFENKAKLHYHWGEEHEDELNSHQKDKVKKARRKKENEKKEITAKRKQMAGYGLFGVLSLVVIGFLAFQIVPLLTAGPDQQEDFPLEDRPVLGNEDANVTLVEFGDYACTFCGDFEFDVKDRLEDEGYFDEDGGVNFYYLHYPLPVDPVGSELSAVSAECVADQDQDEFWNFHSALFVQQNQFEQGLIDYSEETMLDIAEDETEGLDYDQLEQCIDDRETVNIVNNDRSVGDANQVSGTPTVFLNGQNVPNPTDYSQVESMIERELD